METYVRKWKIMLENGELSRKIEKMEKNIFASYVLLLAGPFI